MSKHVQKIAASLMCDSFTNLERSLAEMEEAGVDLIHVDIMDGSFVPNFTLGPDIISSVKRLTSIPVDIHLMCMSPERHLDLFLAGGPAYFSIHQESCLPLTRSIQKIKDAGVKAGVALCPATSVGSLEAVIPMLDFVLLMMVEPGFAGQKIVPFSMDKVDALRSLADRLNQSLEIEVDGNVGFENAPEMIMRGANILVGGSSSIFRKGISMTQGCARLRDACQMCIPGALRRIVGE